MSPRPYRLGKRQPSVDHTGRSILEAAREMISERPSPEVSVSAIARRAGVSRLTVYNRFGSRARLLEALKPPGTPRPSGVESARAALQAHFQSAATTWAGAPGLFRNLPAAGPQPDDAARALAERLASEDALRPGCSLREAEDAIGALSSFAVFDRLHRDGRRSPAAVAEVLMRLASGILT